MFLVGSLSKKEEISRSDALALMIKDQNIGKHEYIGTWILRTYRKYR